MTAYEYIRVDFHAGDLEQLNRLASTGWHVVGLFHHTMRDHDLKENFEQYFALLERPYEGE